MSEGSKSLQLRDRLALRPREAAEALGLSERALRQLLPQLPHVRVGGAVLLPVAELREWLRDRAQAGAGRVDKAVTEILDGLQEPG